MNNKESLILFAIFATLMPLTANSGCVEKLYHGASHTCAKLITGDAKCWGAGTNGRLGVGDTANKGDDTFEQGVGLIAINFGLGRKVIELGLGTKQTCAILDDYTLKCLGGNASGQLGYEDTVDRGGSPSDLGNSLPTVNLGKGVVPTAVIGGFDYTCVILNGTDVKCFGGNAVGQLGYEDVQNRGNAINTMGDNLPIVNIGTKLSAINLSVGDQHTCVLTSVEKIKCWGLNTFGQLGYGDTKTRGDEAGEMGDNLPFVDIGDSRLVQQVSLGDSHTCVLTNANLVLCFGNGANGRLGTGSVSIIGNTPEQMGNSLIPVNFGTPNATSISCGSSHSCALLDTKDIKCWGQALFGRLGLGYSIDIGTDSAQMGDNLPITYLGFTFWSKQVIAAGTHSCGLIESNSDVKCWGNGQNGRLGNGETRNYGNNQGEMGFNLPFTSLCDDDTAKPTRRPSTAPTVTPSTISPTSAPSTLVPTASPSSLSPTDSPTKTRNPTKAPAPSKSPTLNPTKTPSSTPTKNPVVPQPTFTPSSVPTTSNPTKNPTSSPVIPCKYDLKSDCLLHKGCSWKKKSSKCIAKPSCATFTAKKCKKNKSYCKFENNVCFTKPGATQTDK